jgi:hypothetical protein
MWKNCDYLAKCLVPIGEQIGMSNGEKVEMLERKTKRFAKDDIQEGMS